MLLLAAVKSGDFLSVCMSALCTRVWMCEYCCVCVCVIEYGRLLSWTGFMAVERFMGCCKHTRTHLADSC